MVGAGARPRSAGGTRRSRGAASRGYRGSASRASGGQPLNGPTDPAALALEAFHHGQAATAAGDSQDALRWLDRAWRLTPRDPTVALALATACLAHDDSRAEALFARIVAEHDVREAWLGLATARRRLGNAVGAAQA